MCSWCWLIIGICIGITGTCMILVPSFFYDAVKSDRMIEDLTESIFKLRKENKKLRDRLEVYKDEQRKRDIARDIIANQEH